jgi:NAD(P)-dependent dehydrogenase (short-subunit alcohol dehydrogenase family)
MSNSHDNKIDNNVITLSELMQPGNAAVVTGASSGIGKSACMKFASYGMNVWMIDVDAAELALAQKIVKEQYTTAGTTTIPPTNDSSTNINTQFVFAEVVDVSDYPAMCRLAQQVFDATGKCHIVMNNAGIGMGGDSMTDIKILHKVMDVNTYGPIHGCLAFVPLMKASDEPGIIINTGSKQGITMPPGNLCYNMSKAALKVYTEGLEHEFMAARTTSHGKLRAVLLIPGWVNTSIALKANRYKAAEKGETYADDQAFFHEEKPHSDAWMPHQVLDFMQTEIDQGRFYIVCPDNDVDREMDNLRMTWTMQDITQNRPPLSRWHPDYKDQFTEYLQRERKASK